MSFHTHSADTATIAHENPGARDAIQPRAAGALLFAGSVIFFLAEFITAAAWTDPPYSYTYHFISDLGVQGPSTLFGQYMYSPLAWVMNTGFFLFGITILAGVVLLRGLSGLRRWAVLAPATLLAVGGVLLGVFHGSGEALNDGTGQFHSIGAFAGFIGANALAIVLGSLSRRLGFSRKLGRGLIAAGVLGLLSMTAYLIAIFSAADTVIGIIGLIERGAAYPFLIGMIVTGATIWNRRTMGTGQEGTDGRHDR